MQTEERAGWHKCKGVQRGWTQIIQQPRQTAPRISLHPHTLQIDVWGHESVLDQAFSLLLPFSLSVSLSRCSLFQPKPS